MTKKKRGEEKRGELRIVKQATKQEKITDTNETVQQNVVVFFFYPEKKGHLTATHETFQVKVTTTGS